MDKIVSEILKNNNIDNNLKAYYGKFMEINNKYAVVRLAMNYYTWYMMSENTKESQMKETGETNALNEIIGGFITEESVNDSTTDSKIKTAIEELEQLRKKIIERVGDLTGYVDMFNVYEHALNRVEYRFKETELPTDYSDENFTRKLMQFILEDEDNMSINRKISQIIGQLPLHLTKTKFYELISDGMSIYRGGTKESFNDFLYMLRTSSVLTRTDTMNSNYPLIKEVFDGFSKIDFKTITSEQYDEMNYNIIGVSEYIEDMMNDNMMTQEIINDLLIILYTANYRQNDDIISVCEEIIKNTSLLFKDRIGAKTAEEIEEMFIMLEGVQEKLYPKLSSFDITEQIKENYSINISNLGLTENYDIVYKLPKLSSDSMFVELDKYDDNSVVDEAYLESEKEKLFMQYGEVFADNKKMINRAIMSAAISELPVFFNNITELQDFIFDNLSICRDKAEKLACIEILEGIMDEYR